MQLNRLFFIFYRLVEKYTSIRLESYILYSLFVFYYFVFFGRLVKPIKRKDFDKRELWEKFRFKNISNLCGFKTAVRNCLLQGPINFENTMELSIRGHYILQGELVGSFRVKAFLHFILIANLLCPDLYIKKEGLRLRDRSNNHQFYVLFFSFKFLKQFYALDTSRKLLAFVEVRLECGMLNEGSTYYHLGVIGCIYDLISSNVISPEKLQDYPKLNECIENFDCQYRLLSKVNFGDRDGTFLVEYEGSKNVEFPGKASLLKSVYIETLTDDSILFINNLSDSEFGTGGHFHDDYGHLVLQKNDSTIVHDLGIYKYQLEPMHCRREYHNLPYFSDTPGVEYKSQFVRLKKHNTFCKVTKYFIMFASVYDKKSIRRYFLFKTKRVIDIAVGSGDIENLFALNFELFKDGLLSEKVLDFEFSNLLSEQLYCDFYYPDYCIKEKCMHYKIKWSLPQGSTVSRLMRLRLNV
jgi:hypothetical protein